jgi:hypothetical protein
MMRRWAWLFAAVAGTLLFYALVAPRPAPAAATIRHRVYSYPTSPTLQVNIPCGSSTSALVVYDELTISGELGIATAPIDHAVSLNGTLLWQEEPASDLRLVLRSKRLGRAYQRLTAPGVWSFAAEVAGDPASRSVCEIRKV